jgi:hypothetical protein
MGFHPPSALAVAGAHFTRVCLARYLAPPGFVSPPGAFLLPQPPRPCFMPRTLVGFTLRSFPLRGEGVRLSTRPYPLAVGSSGPRRPPHASPSSRALLPPEVRCAFAERSRRAARCSLGFHLPRGFLPGATTCGFPRVSSLGLGAGFTSRTRPSESRSRPGRFVSVETTAPLEVPAPCSGSSRFEVGRP